MIQEILVAIIGIAVAVFVLYKVYNFFFSKNKTQSSCGCSGNCKSYVSKHKRVA